MEMFGTFMNINLATDSHCYKHLVTCHRKLISERSQLPEFCDSFGSQLIGRQVSWLQVNIPCND